MIRYIVVFCVFCAAIGAYGFDFSRYIQGDLDSLVRLAKPASGVVLVTPQKLRFQVSLVEYGKRCDSGFLKNAMIMAGAPKDAVEKLSISTCITVKTEKGASALLFIQDRVSEFLLREVKIGGKMDIFCDYLYVGKNGPGIMVSEFQNIN